MTEKEFRFKVFCKHQGHLINQGITMCNIGHDPSKCDTCEFREPDTTTGKMTSTSTQVDHIYHGNSRRQWYEEYHKFPGGRKYRPSDITYEKFRPSSRPSDVDEWKVFLGYTYVGKYEEKYLAYRAALKMAEERNAKQAESEGLVEL